jgi:TRAP transporter TAXI family solute receptor
MKKYLIKLVTAITLIAIIATLAFTGCEEEAAEYSLKITAIGEGTTSPAPGTYTKTEGESVTVTATPNTGYELGYWEGDVSGTDDSVTFKMTSDKSVVAVFVEEVIIEEWEWPEKMIITTAQLGGSVYATFMAWTAVLQNDVGTMVRVVPEDNEALRKKMVQHGDAFMCGFNEGTKSIYEAQDIYATRDGGVWYAQSIWTLIKGSYSFMVRGDSEIRTIYDIQPGVKIAVMPGVPGMDEVYEAFLAWAGLTLDDAVQVPFGTFDAMIRSVPNGTADVAFIPGLAHSAVYEAEAAPHGLHWIDLNPNEDPDGAARFVAVKPGTLFAPITEGVPSVQGVWGVLVVSTMGTRADADEELVYNLTKWLYENWDDYKDQYFYCETSMSWETMRAYLDVTYDPFHDGTIRFLEEIGEWTEADELRQEYNRSLATRYVEAYQAAIAEADELDIVVHPTNEEWVDLWESYKSDIPPFQGMTDDQIREALGK